MILQPRGCGKVGRCRGFKKAPEITLGGFSFCLQVLLSTPSPVRARSERQHLGAGVTKNDAIANGALVMGGDEEEMSKTRMGKRSPSGQEGSYLHNLL